MPGWGTGFRTPTSGSPARRRERPVGSPVLRMSPVSPGGSPVIGVRGSPAVGVRRSPVVGVKGSPVVGVRGQPVVGMVAPTRRWRRPSRSPAARWRISRVPSSGRGRAPPPGRRWPPFFGRQRPSSRRRRAPASRRRRTPPWGTHIERRTVLAWRSHRVSAPRRSLSSSHILSGAKLTANG